MKHLLQNVIADGYPLICGPLPEVGDDDAVDKYVRATSMTAYHYTSSCRMAPENEGGVVDDPLKVHGVHGLRVADTSICPQVPATNPAAVAVMIAEKCSDMVKEDNGDIF